MSSATIVRKLFSLLQGIYLLEILYMFLIVGTPFLQVSEHASWSGCFYFRIIQAALAAVGAPENLVDVITGSVYYIYAILLSMRYKIDFLN